VGEGKLSAFAENLCVTICFAVLSLTQQQHQQQHHLLRICVGALRVLSLLLMWLAIDMGMRSLRHKLIQTHSSNNNSSRNSE